MPDLSWELFEHQVSQCQMCGLCQNIHHKVPGQGDRHSPLMLIGEGPGQVEDEEGLAFVGPAGRLLTKCLLLFRSRATAFISATSSSAARRRTASPRMRSRRLQAPPSHPNRPHPPESHRPARLNRREEHHWGGHPHHSRPRQVVRAQRHLDDGDVSPVGAPARPVKEA